MKRSIKGNIALRYWIVRKCACCGEIFSREEWERVLCEPCEIRYRAAKLESCPSSFLSVHECRCMPPLLSKSGVLCLRKLSFYRRDRHSEPQNQMIYRLKEKPNCRVAEFLTEELARGVREELATLGRDTNPETVCVVGVPRSRRSMMIYGYDQALLLAECLARVLGVSYVRAIDRRYGGKEQKRMKGFQRVKNISGQFYLTKEADALRDRCVILVDDVVTTGASMAACAKLLRGVGAREILGVVIGQNENRRDT